MRRVAVVAVALFAAHAWVLPVDGPVVRPFRPPATRYGRGHRGADLRAAPGTPVRAANDGVVTFAGTVGTTRHVVVRHANGDRTSYSFLASLRVHAGERVRAGEVVGTTGGTGPNHDGSALHFGLRVGGAYVDPMQLYGAPDLTARVHLAAIRPSP